MNININTRDLAFVDFNNEEMQWVKFNGKKVYEAFKKLIGVPPLTLLNCKGVNLVDYKIYGSTIQEGTPTPETPIEIQSVGDKTKNILDNSELLMDTHYKTDGNQGYYEGRIASPKINVKDIDTISLKYSRKISTNVAFLSWDAEGNLLERSVTKISSSQTSSVLDVSNCYEIAFFWWGTLAETIKDIYDVMIAEGEEILDYEPKGYRIPIKTTNDSEETITNIYLNQPLRKIGDYIDYIDFKNKKVIRKNCEIISPKLVKTSDGTVEGTYRYYISTAGTYQMRSSNVGQGFCTHLPTTTNFNVASGIKFGWGNSHIYFIFPYETLAEVNAWETEEEEKGTPLKAVYQLATPIEEDIELPNIPTLKGATILEVDTSIQPSNMEVVYKPK